MMNTADNDTLAAPPAEPASIRQFSFIFRVHASVKRQVNQHLLSTLAITYSQASALVLLTRGSEVSCHDLAALLGCGTSRISRLMQELENRQLVARSRCRVDRRELRLALTAEGAALAARVPAVMLDAERALLRVLPHEECRMLSRLLLRVVSNCERSAQ
ncbi:MarR family winged helix-turn-helix transcriptional regulator [Paraburkholderia youngii]|uniref:Winged helix-turn-helix transcriptional regulator n=1 Tax=Paraburkholderia youngii TaxID=2782701 RepID=A0A7Y6MYW2_9BURK|nr:MarR family winged helix-turn-helix transcriptional regulator [Paraburkholderia youngii]NUY02433.1 winged helix-turn-helix transcriptional regulator [Paraburkholderia youngii]